MPFSFLLFLHKNKMKMEQPEIIALRKAVEATIPRKIKTPYDFNYLAGAIMERTKEMLSETTLKRVWGYIDGYDTIRQHTLQVLARFAGYESYEDFYAHFIATSDSAVVAGQSVQCEQLEAGSKVRFAWLPDRECVAEFLGGQRFRVVSTANTQLHLGDCFCTPLFILGEPLYLHNIERDGKPLPTYVVGKKSGLTAVEVLSC